jgi:hypothetical protein
MDVAILAHATSSEAAETILVHSSGVHGVEGFAGSAIQIAALSRLSTGSGDHWRSGSVCTVFVHAVNPFGFASLRRFNENNVDLSRNNLSPAQWSMARARHPNHAGYADFDAALNLAHPPQWYVSVSAFVRVRARARVCECVLCLCARVFRYDRFVVLLSASRALLTHGFLPLKRAIVTGPNPLPQFVSE